MLVEHTIRNKFHIKTFETNLASEYGDFLLLVLSENRMIFEDPAFRLEAVSVSGMMGVRLR
jgi:hypothetical protein